MEIQETERVTDRQVIKSRQKKFFAFCLAILIGCMPTVNVLASTIYVNENNVGTMMGQTLSPGDVLNWRSAEITGRMKVYYVSDGTSYDSGKKRTTDGPYEHTIKTCDTKGFLHWKVEDIGETNIYDGDNYTMYTLNLKPIIGDVKDDKDDDSDDTPFIYNPDALAAVYYENGVPSWKAKFGKQTQGAACAMAFKNALPAGWKEGITFSMSVEDKYTYDPKTGTLVLCVPDALQKTGRQYAVMGIDKNSKVTVFYDTDNKPFLFTSKLNLEGYAFALIYKEP
ncbi:MAG: hypothetical protein K5847_01745 [Lachnospiraceae bacterium]|nr:hypothetical protein [Lachnospiraceae bacterium]